VVVTFTHFNQIEILTWLIGQYSLGATTIKLN